MTSNRIPRGRNVSEKYEILKPNFASVYVFVDYNCITTCYDHY